MTPQDAIDQLAIAHGKFHPLGSPMGMIQYWECPICLVEWVTYFYPMFSVPV